MTKYNYVPITGEGFFFVLKKLSNLAYIIFIYDGYRGGEVMYIYDMHTDETIKVDTKSSTEETYLKTTEARTVTSIEDIVNEVTNRPKRKIKRQISTYLDEEVAKAFDKYGNKNGKGAKAILINTLLKKALKVGE